MRNYRYKVQTNTFGLFVGITAELVRTDVPPRIGDPVSGRIWLDASQAQDAFRDTPLPLSDCQIDHLQAGLLKVADAIELIEDSGYLLVVVRALEIVDADYTDGALAPAIAGWATAEFGLTPHRVHASFNKTTQQYLFEWDN
ncbi:MAG: hypothetical protein JWN52_4762 [Actinomycetia bacterium]|nr:hypothetical protein [Actinomycetes bacterium]